MVARHYFTRKTLPPHEPYTLTKLDTETGRYYERHDGKLFPSVTTVLDRAKDKRSLEKWRKEVGEEKASRVTTQAQNRGTQVHSIFEDYVLNMDNYDEDVMPSALENFLRIQALLDQNLSAVYDSEIALYSDFYNTAGSADLVAEWCGTPTILDLKTCRKLKSREHYDGYFIQVTAYALMLNEILGNNLFIPQVALIMLPDDGRPEVWESHIGDYAAKVYDIFVRDQRLKKG
jgi:genome maintenance exonuclease 1